jgi:hypothetical protein
MSARGRIAKLERAHGPASAVVLWVQAVNGYPTVEDFIRACIDEGHGTMDLERLQDQVVASVTDALKGEPPAEVARATGIALSDAHFLYNLVLVLNSSVFEFAGVAGLQASILFHELRSLRRDPLSEDVRARRADPEGANRVDAAWDAWQAAVEAFIGDVRAEERARSLVVGRFFDAQAVLYAQCARLSASLEAAAGLLDRRRDDTAPTSSRTRAELRGRRNPKARSGSIESRAAARADELIDDARVATYEHLGEHQRARAILERRFRA